MDNIARELTNLMRNGEHSGVYVLHAHEPLHGLTDEQLRDREQSLKASIQSLAKRIQRRTHQGHNPYDTLDVDIQDEKNYYSKVVDELKRRRIE